MIIAHWNHAFTGTVLFGNSYIYPLLANYNPGSVCKPFNQN